MDRAEITMKRKKGSGGRPADKFSRDHVDVLEDGRVKCKYCGKEFARLVDRIRVHLSGEGSGISYCLNVPDRIREQASVLNKESKIQQKRKSKSNNDLQKRSERGGGSKSEKYVTKAYLKFTMATNTIGLSRPCEFLKYPLFREFLESIDHHGVPLSLLAGHSKALDGSGLSIKHEVAKHILELKASWDTLGRTFMGINLRNNHENKMFLPLFEKDVIVIVIYCPTGIVFVEQLDSGLLAESLKRHSPRLDIDKGVQWLSHRFQGEGKVICELNDIDRWQNPPSGEVHYCLRNDIQDLYGNISDWARSLIDIAMKIHDYLTSRDVEWYLILFNMEDSPISIFLAVIQYHHDKKSSTYKRLIESDIEEITSGSEFWSEGWKLELILNCVIKIGDVMDTLVPTSGYLGMALDKVSHILIQCGLQSGEDALQLWVKVRLKLECGSRSSRLAASYLNPVYFLQQLDKDSDVPEKLKSALQGFAKVQGVDLKEIDEEVKCYIDVFTRLSENIPLKDHHPVKLWEEHGRHISTLHKCAIMLLSRPLNCMGKQLKEHLYHLKGSDDYITRLNFRMMKHFEELGDDIYKPLDLSELNFDKFSKHVPWKSVMRGSG